jgi:hypothetical protein
VNTKLWSMVLLGAMAAAPVWAQQPPDAAKAPAAPSENSTAASKASSDEEEAAATRALIEKSTAAAAARAAALAPAKPTNDSDLAKQARNAGWHPETHSGEVLYCREDPIIGSRFKDKRCVSQAQMVVVLEQTRFQKDALQSGACNGASCSAGK